MSLPGIGAKGADKILELRKAKEDLELDDLNQVPYLRLTPQLIDCLDFTSFEDKEGLGLMATSIVPELMYFYIPLGLVSL
jgi:predicted DNA-binding helix-hairpin-helix protein